MSGGKRSWSSEDSRHCWEALRALWSEKIFANYFLPKGIVKGSSTVEEVESVTLNWDGIRGSFTPWNGESSHSG